MSNFNVGMGESGDRQCLMKFISDVYLFSFLCRNDMIRQASKLDSTITFGSFEDVSFTVELDRAALSRVRKWVYLARIPREYGRRSKRCHGQHHRHD